MRQLMVTLLEGLNNHKMTHFMLCHMFTLLKFIFKAKQLQIHHRYWSINKLTEQK